MTSKTLPPGWSPMRRPGWYQIDLREMFLKVPLDQFRIDSPLGYTQDNESAIKWTTECVHMGNTSRIKNKPKPIFNIQLSMTRKSKVIDLGNGKTETVTINQWDLSTWRTRIKPYWPMVTENLADQDRNQKIVEIVRSTGAYGDEFHDVDLLTTWLGGTISGLCDYTIPIRTAGGHLIEESPGLCVLHVGLFGGGRSTLLGLLRSHTPWWIGLGMTSSMKGLIQLMNHCPVGPVIDDEFGESLREHAGYQEGKARAVSTLVSDKRVGDQTKGRGQEVAEIINISVIGAANELDPFMADGKIASHLYIVRYPLTKDRGLKVSEVRQAATPRSFEEAIGIYRKHISERLDAWSPEVIRWANFMLSNLVSGRVSIEWEGEVFRIPALNGLIFPEQDEWWDRVRGLYRGDGSTDEEDVFSATRWMVLGERVMWNCAVNEIFNRHVFLKPDTVDDSGLPVDGEMWVQVSHEDAEWGYNAVERQHPERKELFALFKGRSGQSSLLGVVRERDKLKRLLEFTGIVVEAGASGIHKKEAASKVGVSSRSIQDYVKEVQALGLPIELDRGICRWGREMGNEKHDES